MTVAGTRYGYQTAPWDSPLSFGVQALIEYNGYVLNDRYQADRIRVTSITGLDDPDVTDSREPLPGTDEEVAYDARYRGRTLVLSGRIEAGSLGTLKRLERDLKAAFAPLVEAPMKFRWFDISDTFDDALTLQNYTVAAGSTSALAVSGGVLRWGTTQNVVLVRSADNRVWGDKQVTLRVIAGSSDSSSVSLVLAYKNAQNYLSVSLSGSTLSIKVLVAGVSFVLASTTVPAVTQTPGLWLRGRTEGDLVTAELWTAPPTNDALPTFSLSSWLQGSDADAFGHQVLTQAGFGAQTLTTNWAFDDFKIESLCPGDVIFNVRKMPNGMSIKDSQDSPTRFNRAFQITCRASRAFASCATQSRSVQFVPSPQSPLQFGFSFPLTFPLKFRKFIGGATVPANTFVTVVNAGTVRTFPKLVVYGAIQDFSLVNLQNGQQINWNGTLVDGDYLIFDCAHRTLVNSAGTNMMSGFSSSSRAWMQLVPGPNDVYFAGSAYSGNTKLVAYLRSAWA